MFVLIRQVLGVSTDGGTTGLARVREQRLVALDTERFLVPQDVSVPGQVEVTVETREDCRRVLDLDLGKLLLHVSLTLCQSFTSLPLSTS